jgi:hypothetical protein
MVIPNAGATARDGEIVDEGPLPDPLHDLHAILVDFFNAAHLSQRYRVGAVGRVPAVFKKSRLENFKDIVF